MLTKIGSRVKEIREIRKMTQEELSERANCSLTTISRLENERSMVGVEKLWAIAQSLDTDFSHIFCDYMDLEAVKQAKDKELIKRFHLLTSENQENIRAFIEIMLSNQK